MRDYDEIVKELFNKKKKKKFNNKKKKKKFKSDEISIIEVFGFISAVSIFGSIIFGIFNFMFAFCVAIVIAMCSLFVIGILSIFID